MSGLVLQNAGHRGCSSSHSFNPQPTKAFGGVFGWRFIQHQNRKHVYHVITFAWGLLGCYFSHVLSIPGDGQVWWRWALLHANYHELHVESDHVKANIVRICSGAPLETLRLSELVSGKWKFPDNMNSSLQANIACIGTNNSASSSVIVIDTEYINKVHIVFFVNLTKQKVKRTPTE